MNDSYTVVLLYPPESTENFGLVFDLTIADLTPSPSET